MLKKNFITPIAVATLLSVPYAAQAGQLISGGYDWNLDFNNSSTSYVQADGVKSSSSDPNFSTNGTANYSKTSGASGGQEWDAESMYLEIKNDTLYVAVVTGLSPTGGWAYGDLFFDLNNDAMDTTYTNPLTYKKSSYTSSDSDVVVAQSGGDGYEYGLVVKDHATNGFDDGGLASASSGDDNYQWVDFDPSSATDWVKSDSESWEQGGLYDVTAWNQGINSSADGKNAVSGRIGTEVDGGGIQTTVNYGVLDNSLFNFGGGGDHYVIETSISLLNADGSRNSFGKSLLDSASNGRTGDINVHWNPLCNNDWIQYTGSLAYGSTDVPEPAPLALMAIGLMGLLARKKIAKKS